MVPLEFFFLLLFFVFQPMSTKAEICEDAYCGFVGVQFPFRLTDQPECCGYPTFNLACKNQDQMNKAIITLPSTGNFTVDSISYFSNSLLISDPDGCMGKRLLQGFDLSGTLFDPKYPEFYIFFNCSSNVSVSYPAIYFSCLSHANYSITAIPKSVYNHSWSHFKNCKKISTISIPLPYPEFPRYHIDDFLLTWKEPDCLALSCNCGSQCQFEDDDGCSSYPYHSKKKADLSNDAKYALIFTVGIPVFFLVALLVYKRGGVRHGDDQRRSSDAEIFNLTVPSAAASVNGLDGQSIEAYPITVLGESGRLPRPNDSTCSICLAEYQAKETIRTIPDCCHYFHANCIDEWLKLNAACPVCRSTPDQATAAR